MSEMVKDGKGQKAKGGATFWVAIALLVILAICSTVILSVRLYDYTKTDDRVLSLKTNMDEKLDVFSVTYYDALGEVVVEGANGEKVVAPGTSVDYTVRLRNTDKTAIDYDLVPEVTFSSEHKIPIKVRLLDPVDNYVAGDAKTWIDIEELNEISHVGTLAKGEAVEYLFQWKWPFESGDDEYDTFLGDTVLTDDISVAVAFSIHAEANTDMDINGGFFGSGAHDNIGLLLFLILLLAAIALLVVYKLIQKRKKTDEANEVGTDEISKS